MMSRRQEMPHTIVLGLRPQGLFLLRELSRAGYLVHAIDARKTPAFHSRYGLKYLVAGPAELAAMLRGWYQRLGGARCYISSGALLDWVIEFMPELYTMYEVYPRPLSSVTCLSRKLETYRLADEFGIACPRTFTLGQVDPPREILASGRKLIAKWNREFTGTGDLPGFKTRLLTTPQELLALSELLSAREREHLLLQQFIEGGPTHNISYQGYYVEGRCIAGLVAQQLRQFPRGVTSYLREYDGPGANAIVEKANRLFAAMTYTGFCEAEFKLDAHFTVPYLLEVNPRAHGLMSALRAKYHGLGRVFSSPLCTEPLQASRRRVEWCNALRDTAAIVQDLRHHRSLVRFSRDLVAWAKPKSIDGLDLGDLRPFLLQPVHAFFGRRRARR